MSKKATEQQKEQKESTLKTISYENQKQVVADFGKDKHSQNAKDMAVIVSYLIETKKMDRFNADFVRQQFLKETNIDFKALYEKNYPDSPVHRALHALSKNDTGEIVENKEKKIQDTFARGQRGFLFKTPKVGLAHPDGFYLKNPKTPYTKGVTHTQYKSAMQRIVERCNKVQ